MGSEEGNGFESGAQIRGAWEAASGPSCLEKLLSQTPSLRMPWTTLHASRDVSPGSGLCLPLSSMSVFPFVATQPNI